MSSKPIDPAEWKPSFDGVDEAALLESNDWPAIATLWEDGSLRSVGYDTEIDAHADVGVEDRVAVYDDPGELLDAHGDEDVRWLTDREPTLYLNQHPHAEFPHEGWEYRQPVPSIGYLVPPNEDDRVRIKWFSWDGGIEMMFPAATSSRVDERRDVTDFSTDENEAVARLNEMVAAYRDGEGGWTWPPEEN